MSKSDDLLAGQNKDFIKSLKRNTKLMIEIYDNLCVNCRRMHWMREKRNIRTGYELYCRSCQLMIDKIGERVK